MRTYVVVYKNKKDETVSEVIQSSDGFVRLVNHLDILPENIISVSVIS